MARPKPAELQVMMSCAVPQSMYDEITAFCRATDRTFSQEMRALWRGRLAQVKLGERERAVLRAKLLSK